ncbi:LysR family transcriptional regulator [Paracoccus aerodenitrificans]|nr:LysR family transcriptional regulator [Paracoccus aerodenitrificans]WBU65648.1 LysR family transcriptional regulator [Paracoccus aerodenitrificans]
MSHPPLHDPDNFPRLQLRVYFAEDVWLGPGKADLLELIQQTGSISEAGRRMGMSYKRAWSLVETLNAMFEAPLVASERGGAGGGGARLTETGQDVLARFRRIEADAQKAADPDISQLTTMLRDPG